MKKTNKILLTSVVMLSSLGLVGALSAKDNSLGDLKFTTDVAGEKVSVGKKGAHVATDMPAEEFVNGTSTRVSNAVVQKSTRNDATSLRFIAAVKANTVTKDKLEVGGELGFHVKAGEVNKNVIVDYVYNSVNAGTKTYKANVLSSATTELTMANFLTDTGMEDNEYNLFMVLEFTNISDDLINTAFEVQPFFIPTGGKVEYSAGTKEAKATGVTATVGSKTAFMEKIAVDPNDKNMLAQYKLVADLKAGDALSFAKEGAKITSIGSGDAAGNNVSSELVVLQDATAATIYLKEYKEGYSVWATGYVEPFDTYLYGSMNGWKQDEKYGLAANPKSETERMITVDLKAEDTFKIYYEGNKDRDSYYGMDDVKAGCLNLLDGTNDISVKEDGKYTFYFSTTPDATADNKYIWIAKATDPVVTGATVKIGDAVAVEMEDVSADKGESDTWIKQYAIKDVTVKAGDKLVFTVDGKVVSPGASGEGNNAKSGSDGLSIVEAGKKVTIYLKVYGDGYDVWATKETTTPVTTGYELKVNGTKATVGTLDKGPTDAYACTVDLKKGDVLKVTNNGTELVFGEDGTKEFTCKVDGTHEVYVNNEGKVYLNEPVEPVGTKYTVTVNGKETAITLIPTTKDHAQFKLTLTKGDKVVVLGDGKALAGGAYNGTEYTVKATGEHTFYVNTKDVVYMDAPAIDPSEVTTVTLTVNFEKITEGNERYAAYLFGGSGNEWVLLEVKNGVSTLTLTEEQVAKYTGIIFCRMNGATTDNNWNNKWDQTADLVIEGHNGKTFTVTGKTGSTINGSWN